MRYDHVVGHTRCFLLLDTRAMTTLLGIRAAACFLLLAAGRTRYDHAVGHTRYDDIPWHTHTHTTAMLLATDAGSLLGRSETFFRTGELT
jgi:hypothetical protein